MALLALLDARHAPPGTWRASLLVVGLIGAALLYGDGVITPAISVLSAVEGLKVDAPQLAPWFVVPVSIADPDRTVPGPAQGHRIHRQHFRTGRCCCGSPSSACSACSGLCGHPPSWPRLARSLRHCLPRSRGTGHRLCRARRRLPGRHRRRGDVCGYGPFRSAADPARLVRRRPALLLCSTISARERLLLSDPTRDRESVLSACPTMGSLSDGGVRHRGHHHRLAGHHIRRLLPHPASDPAGLPAPHAGAPYRQPREGPDLHTCRELAARHRHARGRHHLRLVRTRSAAPTASPSRC